MSIWFLCTAKVLGATILTLNGSTVFENNFVGGAFAMRADSVLCASGLSTKMAQVGCKRASDSYIYVSLLTNLGSRKLGAGRFAGEVELEKESVSKENWHWFIRHIVWDGSAWT